jgi:hypothetical protein
MVRLIRADGSSRLATVDVESKATEIPIEANMVAAELDPFERYLLAKRRFSLSTTR